jgi:hypothetical protein
MESVNELIRRLFLPNGKCHRGMPRKKRMVVGEGVEASFGTEFALPLGTAIRSQRDQGD